MCEHHLVAYLETRSDDLGEKKKLEIVQWLVVRILYQLRFWNG